MSREEGQDIVACFAQMPYGRVMTPQTVTLPEAPWVPPEPPDTLATRLVKLRGALKMSQHDAAVLCGLKPSTWATWENGARPQNLIDVVQAIVAATGVSRDWLLFGETAGQPTHEYAHILDNQLIFTFDGGVEQRDHLGGSWTTPDYSSSTPDVSETRDSPTTRSEGTERCTSRSRASSPIAA